MAVTLKEKVPAPAPVAPPPPPAGPAAAAPAYERVPYGVTPLGRAAVEFRDREKMWGMGNVAVVEYVVGGEVRMLPLASGDDGHSEPRLIAALRAQGVIPPPENVRALYTEREPCCIPPSNCRNQLQEALPGVPISYSYEYGESRESRQAGNRGLDGELGHYRPGREAPDTTGWKADSNEVTSDRILIAREQLTGVVTHFKDDAHVMGLIEGRARGLLDSEIYKEMRDTHDVTRKEFNAAIERLEAEGRRVRAEE